MDRPKGIFSGLKLSEQAQPPAKPVDQRLFSSTPSRPPEPTPPIAPPAEPAASKETVPPPKPREPGRESAAPARRTLPPVATPSTFDLSTLAYRKDTFLFAPEEFEALEDLKLELRRKLDTRVSKQDLLRCAVIYLLEDCRRKGVESAVIAPLKRRGAR